GTSAWFWYSYWSYPFGESHCCSHILMFALDDYAKDHDGHYPAGEGSPEASLSLLHDAPYSIDAEILRGMIVPVEAVQSALDRNGRLDPSTCGWHYVEGLTQNDDRRLALVWCKVALGHHGQRHFDGSREVIFVGTNKETITGAQWPAFL